MELGYIDGHHGFMFTSLSTQSQTSETSAANAFVVFNDPAFGPNGSHYLDTVLQAAAGDQPCDHRRDAGQFQQHLRAEQVPHGRR